MKLKCKIPGKTEMQPENQQQPVDESVSSDPAQPTPDPQVINPAIQQKSMKYRSLRKLFVLNFLSFGFYETVWLSETRQEMVSNFDADIPPAKKMIFLLGFQYILLLLAIVGILVGIPIANKNLAKQPTINQPTECMLDEAIYSGPHQGNAAPPSTNCQEAINNYDNAQDKQLAHQGRIVYTVLGTFLAFLLAMVLGAFAFIGWIKRYADGVAIVTRGQISKTAAINILTLLPPTIRMLIIQRAFNKTSHN